LGALLLRGGKAKGKGNGGERERRGREGREKGHEPLSPPVFGGSLRL